MIGYKLEFETLTVTIKSEVKQLETRVLVDNILRHPPDPQRGGSPDYARQATPLIMKITPAGGMIRPESVLLGDDEYKLLKAAVVGFPYSFVDPVLTAWFGYIENLPETELKEVTNDEGAEAG